LHKLVYARDGILDGNRLSLIRQMGESLDIVHKREFIHRDVCPRNFICAEDGKTVKLIDFGLTLPARREFMQPGNRTGTPLYMAPEVIRRRWTDQRLDVFAFGVTAYHVLTLDLPWIVTETSGLAALAHDTTAPREVLDVRPQTDKRLAAAIMKCLEAAPDDRTQTIEAFLEHIREVEFEDESGLPAEN
jgi:serine/threonine-protein kinase